MSGPGASGGYSPGKRHTINWPPPNRTSLPADRNPAALDRHYETVRVGMAAILRKLGVAA